MSLSGIIEKHRDEIIERWASAAASSASARGLTRPEIIDSVPPYLDSLVEVLREAAGPPTRHARARIADRHIGVRLRQGYDLDQVVHEYILLGQAITHIWTDRAPEDRPTAAEVERLFDELNRSTSAAVAIFTRHLLEEAQAEKRHLAHLQRIAAEAIRTGPLRGRLTELLERLVEGLAVEESAFLLELRDPETGQAAGSAWTGLPDEEAGRLLRALAGSPFAARAAAADEPVPCDLGVLPEAGTTLARGGHAALLALRSRGQMLGLLCITFRGRSQLEPWEERRLLALSERLALLLDNARLYDRWREELDRLRVERELRQQLVSTLAHDLRGPLTAAQAGARLLAQPRPEHEQRELVGTVLRNVDRADRMLRDLLDVSVAEAGGCLPLQMTDCDLGAIVRDVVEALAVVHGERFVVRGAEGVRGVWGCDAVTRAIWNLASNGARHGRQDAPVTISVACSGGEVRVAVHNEGGALTAEEQGVVFRPFWRRRSWAGGTLGWGLGLAVVRVVAEAHGGRVEVDSSPERGTTFTLRLPRDARPGMRPTDPGTGIEPPPPRVAL